MCPVAGRMVNATGKLVAHCLLIETDAHGLVLVDSGISAADMADLNGRLGRGFSMGLRPTTDTARTALEQVKALGFSPADVRNIVLTHLDVDHAGGMVDFPHATVHVHRKEYTAAMNPTTANEVRRYRSVQWAHEPMWNSYETLSGDQWFGFDAVRSLPGLPDSIMAIPLSGHTRGHSAIAVQDGDRWLLHAGDAYFNEWATSVSSDRKPPLGSRLFEKAIAIDRSLVRSNHARLRTLRTDHPNVKVFSAHDPAEFTRLGGVMHK
jgi:glyoxylase-like metal-dependent hydrolase (beta-lactamase superfamily II)